LLSNKISITISGSQRVDESLNLSFSPSILKVSPGG
jgi:hypothetical protein